MPYLSAIAMQPLRMGTPHEGQNRQSSVLTSIEEVLKPVIQVSELADVTSGVNTTSPIASHEMDLENDLQQHVQGKSNGSTDVRWWLSLTLQEINDGQARDDLQIARIIVRRFTERINQHQGNQPKALTFQDLLLETSMLPLFRYGPVNCGKELEEWSEGNQRYCLRLMRFELDSAKIVSVHLSIWHSSGKFPELFFESRLYPHWEMSKAYVAVAGRRNWRFAKFFPTSDIYGTMKIDIDLQQKIIRERPSVVFLRDASGNLALSVSKICSLHRARTNGPRMRRYRASYLLSA